MVNNKLFVFILLLLCFFSKAQNVTIVGNEFKLNGNKFFPMVLNYGVEISSPSPGDATWETSGYITSFVEHGQSNIYECFNMLTCEEQLQNELNYIAGMGFNSIRISAFFPLYDNQNKQLVWQGRDNPDRNWFYIPLDPGNPSDPGTQIVLSFYEKLLQLANNTINQITQQPQPLKIIFILSGRYSEYDLEEITAYNTFFSVLADFISTSPNKNALLAFDLMNEPCNHIPSSSTKSKEEACNIITTWNNTIKTYCPECLVTIGSCDMDDVFSFDQTILNVDFISLHFYPYFKSFEDRTLNDVQDLARIRSFNSLLWLNDISVLPWIVGETGFTASANQTDIMNGGLDGFVNDQENFAFNSLNATYHCGGKGYSWWYYQDGYWEDPNFPGQCFFGLLERGSLPSSSAEKPAVDIFRNYNPEIAGACPVDYSPTYNPDKIYYNPYKYPPNPSKEISGIVKDQNGNPVKNAVVWVKVHMGNMPGGGYLQDDFYTFTDENGFFKAIPYQYGFEDPPPYPGIAQIKISAGGADIFESGWCPGCLYVPYNITLTKKDVDIIIDGETVFNGQSKDYQGRKSLTVSNTVIESGGNAEFTSANSIHFLPGFHAKAGSYVRAYITDIPSDCDDYSDFSLENRRSIIFTKNGENNKTNEKQLELSFKKSETAISVFPNPASTHLTIKLISNDKNNVISYIKFVDITGRTVYYNSVNTILLSLDLTGFSPGPYFLQVSDSKNLFHKKIIIQ